MSRSSADTTRRRPSLTSGCRMNGDMLAIVAATEVAPRAQAMGVDDLVPRILHFGFGLTGVEYSPPYFQQRLRRVGELLGEGVITSAEFDRILHHGHVLNIRGEDHRLRENRQGRTIPVSTSSRRSPAAASATS